MIIWKTTRHAGELLPPWFYGFSYQVFCKDEYVFHLVPINWLFRVWKLVEFKWNAWRSGPGYVDKIIEKEVSRRINAILQHQKEEAFQEVLDMVNKNLDEIIERHLVNRKENHRKFLKEKFQEIQNKKTIDKGIRLRYS